MTCYNCNEKGHYANECPKLTQEQRDERSKLKRNEKGKGKGSVRGGGKGSKGSSAPPARG